MRLHVVVLTGVLCLATAAVAQTSNNVPREIGNRANGFSYQPTPSQVVPREKEAGIRPSAAQQKAADADLDRMYNNLMREVPADQGRPPK
jgi:hypothetical protein